MTELTERLIMEDTALFENESEQLAAAEKHLENRNRALTMAMDHNRILDRLNELQKKTGRTRREGKRFSRS